MTLLSFKPYYKWIVLNTSETYGSEIGSVSEF